MATVEKIIEKNVYVHLKDPGEAEKCPPQALVILKTIKEAEGSKIERSALVELLKDGRLTTRQAPERILGFYNPKIIGSGFVKIDKVQEKTLVEVPDKPAKPAKTEAAADGAEATAKEAAPASVKSKKGTKTEGAGEAAA